MAHVRASCVSPASSSQNPQRRAGASSSAPHRSQQHGPAKSPGGSPGPLSPERAELRTLDRARARDERGRGRCRGVRGPRSPAVGRIQNRSASRHCLAPRSCISYDQRPARPGVAFISATFFRRRGIDAACRAWNARRRCADSTPNVATSQSKLPGVTPACAVLFVIVPMLSAAEKLLLAAVGSARSRNAAVGLNSAQGPDLPPGRKVRPSSASIGIKGTIRRHSVAGSMSPLATCWSSRYGARIYSPQDPTLTRRRSCS